MKFLHTSDWHVGKMARGRSRSTEHTQVLSEICEIARDHTIDATLLAGDIFDTQSPSVESERIAYNAIMELASIAPLYIIAGNHDSQGRWQALSQLVEAANIHIVGNIPAVASHGVYRLTSKSGEEADIAMLPFLHHRQAVTSLHLLDPDLNSTDFHIAYNLLYQQYLDVLSAKMDHSIINILMSHVSTFGGKVGGGERDIHVFDTYSIEPSQFPAHLDYVALGHLHATQTVTEAPTVRYSGAPMLLDFGEINYQPGVTIVEVDTTAQPAITNVPITSGRSMRTYNGTVEELLAITPANDAWLRVTVAAIHKAGELEAIREHFGDDLIELRVQQTNRQADALDMDAMHKPARELFAEYMEREHITDERVLETFMTEFEAEVLESGGH